MTSAPTPDEAREWLKKHPGERVHLVLKPAAEPDPAAYDRLLRILFSPDEADSTP